MATGCLPLNAGFLDGFIKISRVLQGFTCLTRLIMRSGIPVDSHGHWGSLAVEVGNECF